MEKLSFPLLYFQLRENAVLGILVGAGHQVVDRDLRRVKATLQDYLQKQYKKFDDYPDSDLQGARLKVVDISVRPTFHTEQGAFPMAQSVKVPIPIVYGENYDGFFECHLPLQNQRFYYYNSKQLLPLVRNFATTMLNSYTPERLFRLSRLPEPKLDEVPLKVNYSREFRWRLNDYERPLRYLERLAEKYPYVKALRRQMSNYPEAAWEMEEKVNEAIEKLIFLRANVLLVGPAGVGKSAVLKAAIRKIHNLARKEKLEYSFWRILAQRITATAKYLGEWEEMVEGLIRDLQASNGILWVEDILRLVETGGRGPEDSVAAFMLSHLQRGALQLVGEATPQQLESLRQLLPGFAENFQVVEIPELPEKKVQGILEKFAEYAQQQMQIRIPADSQQLAYRLLHRYYPYEQFPGKGIKFLAACTNEAQLNQRKLVTREEIIRQFIRQTGLPELFLRDDLLLDQAELSSYFRTRIIGQDAAVEKLCEIVKIYKAGLNNPHKPITTLLFAGPTGVGKTASAKAMADYFFGKGRTQSPLVRIDMSEFQYAGQLGRLIGTGKEVGQLVREIRERPFAVLLLDEVEKADPSIFDALLTVLDEGLLVDAYGRITNFRNTIIVMTTNLGASNRQSIGFSDTTGASARYESAIAGFFRPEFINRIDNVVLFDPLKKEAIRQITMKELSELNQREGIRKRGLRLDFRPGLIDRLLEVGFDERYGARPLQRAIEEWVVQPLAQWLVGRKSLSGNTLELDIQDDKLHIEPR